MLVYLSFLVCLSSGASCHTTVPAERAFMGLAACEREGMMLAPSWEDAHASWHVSKIRCSLGNRPKPSDQA